MTDKQKDLDVQEKEQEDQEVKMEETGIDLGSVKEVSSQVKPLTDFEKHRLQPATIEHAEIVRLSSGYAKAKDGKVHRLKLIGEVVEVVEKEDRDKNKIRIEIRPSELINCEEDDEGNFLGLSDGEKSQWTKLKKALNISKPEELKGKKLPMKINKSKNESIYLGFMY